MSQTPGGDQVKESGKARSKPEPKNSNQLSFAVAHYNVASSAWDDRPSPAGRLLQRQCECGAHTIAGNECQSCRQQRGTNILSRETISRMGEDSETGSFAGSSDRSKSTKAYDLSGIPVHTIPGANIVQASNGAPTFNSLKAKVTGTVAVTDAWNGNCELAFGVPGSPGITIESEVTCPTGSATTGDLEYIQLVDTCRQRTTSGGTQEKLSGTGLLDTSDPYESKAVNQTGGKVSFKTTDSPGSPTGTNRTVSTNDSFNMWLVWKPTGGSRAALGKVSWNWAGTATKKTGASGTSTTDWTVSGNRANGGTGTATTTLPTWSANVTGLTWAAGTCKRTDEEAGSTRQGFV